MDSINKSDEHNNKEQTVELTEDQKKVAEGQRRMKLLMRYRGGEDLTKEELCDVMGFDIENLPKFKKGKRNFRVRRLLGLLTQKERIKYDSDQRKSVKCGRGAEKIYNLIERGFTNVTTA